MTHAFSFTCSVTYSCALVLWRLLLLFELELDVVRDLFVEEVLLLAWSWLTLMMVEFEFGMEDFFKVSPGMTAGSGRLSPVGPLLRDRKTFRQRQKLNTYFGKKTQYPYYFACRDIIRFVRILELRLFGGEWWTDWKDLDKPVNLRRLIGSWPLWL